MSPDAAFLFGFVTGCVIMYVSVWIGTRL